MGCGVPPTIPAAAGVACPHVHAGARATARGAAPGLCACSCNFFTLQTKRLSRYRAHKRSRDRGMDACVYGTPAITSGACGVQNRRPPTASSRHQGHADHGRRRAGQSTSWPPDVPPAPDHGHQCPRHVATDVSPSATETATAHRGGAPHLGRFGTFRSCLSLHTQVHARKQEHKRYADGVAKHDRAPVAVHPALHLVAGAHTHARRRARKVTPRVPGAWQPRTTYYGHGNA